MIYTGYDLPGSLKTCDGLKVEFEQVSCSGGVFMENFNSSYGVTSKYLRKNDPIYPCDEAAERHKGQCYGLVTANLLRTTGYDQKKTADGCRRSEPDWVGICFESFGRDVSGIAGKSASKAMASCRLATRERGRLHLRRRARDRELRRRRRAWRARSATRRPRVTARRCFSGRRLGDVLDRDAARQAARRVPPAQRPLREAVPRGRGARASVVALASWGWTSLQQETTALLQRLIRLNTVNPPGAERDLQEVLAADLREAGFEVELLGAEPERPNLVARLRGASDGPTLCLLSHVDTVLAKPDGVDARPVVGRSRRRLRVGPRRAGHEVADGGRGHRGARRSHARAGGPRAATCSSSWSSTRRSAARSARCGSARSTPTRCAATTCSTRAAAPSSRTTAGATTASASPRRASFASA